MESKLPVVSVVIPVYNAGAHLSACLESVKAQTFRQWEAILVDDGSTDDSARICDEAAEKDPRFRVIHKTNAGVSSARNDGIEAATGKYLIFVDADDLVTRNCFAHMVRTADLYGADLVLCSFDRFDDESERHVVLTNFQVSKFADLKQFLMLYTVPKTNMFGVSIWAKLFRTDLIRAHGIRFDPAISYEEDCAFIADFLPHTRAIWAMGESMYRYRQQEESLSKGYRKDTFRFLVNGYDRRCTLLRENGLSEYLPQVKEIFFFVIRNTCKKIALSDLGRTERIAEYETLMSFPQVLDAAVFEEKPDTGLDRRIGAAIRAKDPKRLDRAMRIWKVLDAAVRCKNDLINAIKTRGKKEDK